MPWNLTFHETRPENPRPGDCWYDAAARDGEDADFYRKSVLSAQYEQQHRANRPPIIVFMPVGGELCLDMAFRTNGAMHPGRPGWDGHPPARHGEPEHRHRRLPRLAPGGSPLRRHRGAAVRGPVMRRLLLRALARAVLLGLELLSWVDSLRHRLAPRATPMPPPDACFLCKASLGTTTACLLCDAKRKEAGG